LFEKIHEGRLRREKENRTSNSDRAAERKLATAAPNGDGEVAHGDRPPAMNGAVVGEILIPQLEGDGRARSSLKGGLLEATELAYGHRARSRIGEGDVQLRVKAIQYREKEGAVRKEEGGLEQLRLQRLIQCS
jgi:hypothetical protein